MVACQARSGGSEEGQATGKLVKEIMVAAKLGGADPAGNARLAAVVEKGAQTKRLARRDRARDQEGRGVGGEKLELEQIVFEGYAPHKVPVIVEVQTDNKNRTAPEIRVLFKRGQLGAPGSNKFLFDHVGLVEAHHPDANADAEAAAIEAGAQDFVPLTNADDTEIPEGTSGARFITAPTDLHAVSQWLRPEWLDDRDERARLYRKELSRN